MHRILPRFTASPLQVTAYLGGIALFSISFLVFLNASLSFVITDVIGQRSRVGNAVGTLGFADELVAIVACPMWGLVSDRVGVRWVAVAGYAVIGFSLICLVQSTHVYPDLIIWRMLFSVGAAAATTMVTAILPAMTASKSEATPSSNPANGRRVTVPNEARTQNGQSSNRLSLAPSESSDMTITPARFERQRSNPLLARYRHRRRSLPQLDATNSNTVDASEDASRLAGFVGMFTGIGALIALAAFLPLPTWLGKDISKAQAVRSSFYIVGVVAFCVAVLVALGLRNLPGEDNKGFKHLFRYGMPYHYKYSRLEEGAPDSAASESGATYLELIKSAVVLGFTDSNIALGYIGGFVARASSVGISSFIPLFVNAYFIREGICTDEPGDEIRKSCERAYKLASMLTGISQLVALLAAPLYGFFNARYARRPFASKVPLALAAVAGIIGYTIFGKLQSPDPKVPAGRAAIIAVILIGLSQIGAIVCSLGVLAQGIQASSAKPGPGGKPTASTPRSHGEEDAPLLPQNPISVVSAPMSDRSHLKGSIAGVYSLAGGAAILLLTKLGGHLFDVTDPGAPFYLLAGFNALLLVAVAGICLGVRFQHPSGEQAERAGNTNAEREETPHVSS
ncbi:hypothetical protein ANO11243_013920 [Dothideomycetidae sp. 11243]|nr:hypothetical protein ANO11243_013920 [fungal sp. No.11243]